MASQVSRASSGFSRRTGDLAASTVDHQHHQAIDPTRTMHAVDLQAAGIDGSSHQSFMGSGNTAGASVGTQSGSRSHPTLRFSHIQHTASPGHSIARAEILKASAGKHQYHEAISRNTEKSFNEQLARSFASPIESREVAQGRPPSLAATHPALYKPKSSNSESQPPASTSMQSGKRTSLSSSQSPLSTSSSFALPGTEVPWRSYADPMYQTSSDPQYWATNRTILKVDANTEHGNVISPTWMVGLPLGSMTEMAEAYPELDKRSL